MYHVTHLNPLIEKKANFFIDYFNYITDNIGLNDEIEVENYLSLIEKIIFHIKYNTENCARYIDNYFSHPLLNKENQYFKEFQNYKKILSLKTEYNTNTSIDKKAEWITKNKKFLKGINSFRSELKRNMFDNSLQKIISYLKCGHEISEHLIHLRHHTTIIVSDFILNKWSRSDIQKILDLIFSKNEDIGSYPKNFRKNYPHLSIKEAKKSFVQNMTLQDQFETIKRISIKKRKNKYFIYRVIGVGEKNSDFEFKYNNVTFYNPNHTKLIKVKNKAASRHYLLDFFDRSPMLIAVTKIQYYSSEIAEQDAQKVIQNELDYLNYICNSTAYLEKKSFFITENFKNIGWRKSFSDTGHDIGYFDLIRLKENPYKFLDLSNQVCATIFLNYESIFIKAMTSHSMPDYWNYLEAILPIKNDKGKKQITDFVSSILLLTAQDINKRYIKKSIDSLFTSHKIPIEDLGITQERYNEIYGKFNLGTVDYTELSKEIKYPFLSHLFKQLGKSFSKEKFKNLKAYYSRIICEHQGQRNAIVHSGSGNEKALVLLSEVLPFLIARLRWILIDKLKSTEETTWDNFIKKLKEEAEELLK